MTFFRLSLSALITLNLALPLRAQEGAAMSETIQGEVKEKLTIQKVPPEIDLSIKEIVESGTAQTDTVLQEARPIPSESDFAYVAGILNSTQILKPWNPLIPEPPLVSFQTGLSNVAAKRWEFRVSDEKGEVVKIIQGKGVPPRTIEWNGLSERGSYILVGTLYSYQFITFDEHNNANTFPGEPFQLDCLMFREKGKLIIEFSNKKLFSDGKSEFHQNMIGFWSRALDVIREHSNSPITLEMYAESTRSNLAEERRQVAITSIADTTSIPSVDLRHTVNKITDRGDVLRLVMNVK